MGEAVTSGTGKVLTVPCFPPPLAAGAQALVREASNESQTAHSHRNENAGCCQGCTPLTCLLPWGPAGQLPVSMLDSSTSQRTEWQAGEGSLCLVRRSLGIAGGAHMDFRLRRFAVPVAWPSDPTLPQSRGTGGGCHSAVGHSHTERFANHAGMEIPPASLAQRMQLDL